MSYFSRLTDIVTCNLTAILAREPDQNSALEKIVQEMEEGLVGATRSVQSARRHETSLQQEIEDLSSQAGSLLSQARADLTSGDEDSARQQLARKQEIEDLVEGLKLQHQAAVSTCAQLETTQKALQARLAEAKRKQDQLAAGESLEDSGIGTVTESQAAPAPTSSAHSDKVEEELAALKRELGQSE